MSTPQPPVTAILAAIEETRDEIGAAKAEIVNLRTYGRTNRKAILFDIFITILFAAVGGLTVHATQSADQAAQFAGQLHANNVSACEANNVRLVKQERALDAILSQVPPRNAAERAIIAKDLGYIQAGWAPRQCAQAYPLAPGR